MFKRRGMTQKEMEKLADIVVTKLLMTLSSVNDAVQDQELNFLSNIITSDSEYDITEEEMLMGELARLQTILMIYEDQDTVDGYKKAAMITNKIKKIQIKLNKL
tara:strand:- start:144 stop:455 length:312 start_codon:yes stop_codon:yes gene_type:complete